MTALLIILEPTDFFVERSGTQCHHLPSHINMERIRMTSQFLMAATASPESLTNCRIHMPHAKLANIIVGAITSDTPNLFYD